MTFHPLLFLLLLGHVIGDFYTQTNKTPEEKDSDKQGTRKNWLELHSVRYTLATAAVLFFVVQFSLTLVNIFLIVSILHFELDSIDWSYCKKPFIIKQILHIAIIFSIWIMFNDDIAIRTFIVEINDNVFYRISLLPQNPYWTLLGVLVLLRPVGDLIKSNEIWDFRSISTKVNPNAGRMIGYLERLIVFFLLLNNALGTIGFIAAAKAVIRYSEISREEKEIQERIEYFLIGTLLSMVCTFAVYLLVQVVS